MAWQEMTGTRRIIDNYPRYIDYTITFQGGPSDTAPRPGATYSGVTGSGSLPFSPAIANMTFEPQADQVSRIHKVTPNKSRVTVRFRGYYTA